MGRKKRKVVVDEAATTEDAPPELPQPPGDAAAAAAAASQPTAASSSSSAVALEATMNRTTAAEDMSIQNTGVAAAKIKPEETAKEKAAASSGYAMTSHSGEIVQEDIYVSDGSDDDEAAEVVLAGSRMGIMRRGLHLQPQALQQPNRQWTRAAAAADAETTAGETATNDGTAPQKQQQLTEQEILEQLDPAARAARLQQEKQRREHEAALEARRQENETNVRQPPSLFSKRTAFDIRFDQIEEKPWERNLAPGQQPSNEHLAEFFNYGLSEEDWLEYSQQQLLIRQELVDAHNQKRPPDPAIVPIQAPVKSEVADDATAVEAKPQAEADEEAGGEKNAGTADADGDTTATECATAATATMGPSSKPDSESTEDTKIASVSMAPQPQPVAVDVPASLGGAWGAGAAPGSVLAKLMEEQQQQQDGLSGSSRRRSLSPASRRDSLGGATTATTNSYAGSASGDAGGYANYEPQDSSYNQGPPPPPPPPPPPQQEEDYYRGGRGWQQQQQQDGYYPPAAYQQQHHASQQPYYGGRGGGGRGGYRGRGGGGRGGDSRGYQAPPSDYPSYGGGYDSHRGSNKRPRDDPRWRGR